MKLYKISVDALRLKRYCAGWLTIVIIRKYNIFSFDPSFILNFLIERVVFFQQLRRVIIT